MGAVDLEGKKYLSNNNIFADAFNYLIYDGEEVVKANELRELDTTELSIPYGNNARVPVQKYRDLMKLWNAMMDDNAIYVIFGTEIQDKVHYGMPVKDGLYDMIGYSKQIEDIRKSYRKRLFNNKTSNNGNEDGELTSEDGVLKIRLTSEEFLSGLRKDDKLIPIITAVVYLGEDSWDGPRSLFDLLDVRDERLYKYLSDYKLNLISPADMTDDEFDKFNTELGYAMKMIKHQTDDADEIILATDHRKFSSDTAYFLNSVINLNLELEEEDGGVDMCKAMENRIQKERILSVIEYMRDEGKSEKDIIKKIIEKFNVTQEYVLALITPQKI